MKQFNQKQLTNRVLSIIKGQKIVDALNALIFNIASLFEQTTESVIGISIAGSTNMLANRFTAALVAKNVFTFDKSLSDILEDLIENGPANGVGFSAIDIENLIKAGLIVNIVYQGKPNFIAATSHAYKWYVMTYGVTTVEEAIAKKATS